MYKPTIAVDFDGVLNNYTGWSGEDELYEPQPHTREFLEALSGDYTIIVFTCRNIINVRNWLKKYNLLYMIEQVTSRKPKAVAYIDDRAINFNGDYNETLNKLSNFKTYWEE